MRNKLKRTAALLFGFAALAGARTLTTDPLTNLPVYPLTEAPFGGNEPTVLDESTVCKSKMNVDFYSVFKSRVSTTMAWYDGRLKGFKKTHAYQNGRSQNTYYNADGTLIVSVAGEPGKDGEDTDTYSVTYARLTPGLAEKTIVGMNQQKIVCN